MIRVAHWEHASHLHLALTAAAAVLIGFTSFIGCLFLARGVWQRRHRWISTARRALGLAPRTGR